MLLIGWNYLFSKPMFEQWRCGNLLQSAWPRSFVIWPNQILIFTNMLLSFNDNIIWTSPLIIVKTVQIQFVQSMMLWIISLIKWDEFWQSDLIELLVSLTFWDTMSLNFSSKETTTDAINFESGNQPTPVFSRKSMDMKRKYSLAMSHAKLFQINWKLDPLNFFGLQFQLDNIKPIH